MTSRTEPDGTITRVGDLFDELMRRANRAAGDDDRNGYFAALYALMTGRVLQGLSLGRFTNPARLEQLTCHFAARYLAASDAYRNDDHSPACWTVAFKTADRWRPIILQHLLLGMNAHINFDLGIAAAEVSEESDLSHVEADFLEINVVLAELLGDVQERMAAVSPWMGLLDTVGGRKDETIVNFSMTHARDAAWDVAEHFVRLAPEDRSAAEADLDARVARFARVIARPGRLISLAAIPIRLRETAPVADVIGALMRPTTVPDGR